MKPTILKVWTFTSESSPGKVYQTLLYDDQTTSCDCPAWKFRRKTTAAGARTCKHVRFVDMGSADQHAESAVDYASARPNAVKFQIAAEQQSFSPKARAANFVSRRVFDFTE